jgi:hypothetical protein
VFGLLPNIFGTNDEYNGLASPDTDGFFVYPRFWIFYDTTVKLFAITIVFLYSLHLFSPYNDGWDSNPL